MPFYPDWPELASIYMLLLAGTVALAFVLPAQAEAATWMRHAAYWAVALLFFLYGARLNLGTILAGLAHWRLQGLMLASTYLIFSALGLLLYAIVHIWLAPEMALGLLYLAILPSTVQSSIAFTSIAGVNVAAAVCGASISNLLGLVVTPIMAAALLHSDGGSIGGDAMIAIAMWL